MEIKLKNYRCFSREAPLFIDLDKGITGFVGLNNSGKSTVLKFFVELRHIFEQIAYDKLALSTAISSRQSFDVRGEHYDPEEIFNDSNEGDIEIEINFGDLSKPLIGQRDLPLANILLINIHRENKTWSCNVKSAKHPPIEINRSLNVSNVNILASRATGKRYIDLTYLIEECKKIANTLYIGPFRNAINEGTKDSYYDIQIGESFIRQWRTYKTGSKKVNHRAIQRLEDELLRIFGYNSLSIDASEDNKSLQLNINRKSYKLHEVGSGMAQLIVVFANALIKKPSYILIDEPELGLHPSLQRVFLTTLGTFASEGLIFGTHNMGLARTTSDKLYSITIQKNKRQTRLFEATQNLVELMGEMSYSGYREVGYDKVLLVEGVSEVKTIQQFLKFYDLDHKVILLPLGGASLINGRVEHELSELKRLSESDSIYCLIDSEKNSEESSIDQERQDFIALCEKLGITCHVLDRRATENYLTDEAIKSTKGDSYVMLEAYQKLEDAAIGWGKSENWLIASRMSKEDIKDTDLGKFLNQVVSK